MISWSLFYPIIFLLWCASRSLAQIPQACARNATKPSGWCCPIPPGFTRPCGSSRRGVCSSLPDFEYGAHFPQLYIREDLRFSWPRKLFSRVCRCRGHFYGPDCSVCWYGWSGRNCDRPVIRIRRNLAKYNKADLDLLRRVLLKMRTIASDYVILREPYFTKDVLSFYTPNLHEYLINVHYTAHRKTYISDTAECRSATQTNHNHNGPGFLTWHRHFMLLWERLARHVAKQHFGVSNFTFPYWDWTDKTKCDICKNSMIGGEGELTEDGKSRYLSKNSAFRDWIVYCDNINLKPNFHSTCVPCYASKQNRKLTRFWNKTNFPTLEHIRQTLRRRVFQLNYTKRNGKCNAFSELLEGYCHPQHWSRPIMHNRVHDIINGPFQSGFTSPNDPLFIFHHLQIDRIFQLWFVRNQPDISQLPVKTETVGHCRDCNQVGFFPPVPHNTMFVDTKRLGYDYDSYRFGDSLEMMQ